MVLQTVADLHEQPQRGNYDECLQTMLGSLLCADRGAKAMPQLHGKTGNNMKSELVQILKLCVPDTFTSIDDSVLTSTKVSTGGPDPLLVKLKGMRVAVMGDTGKNLNINATNIKRITGGDDFAARKLHENGGDMFCVCKPVVCTNHAIQFDVSQQPLVERIGNHYYPFTHVFRKSKRGDELCKNYRTVYLDEFFTHFVRGAHKYALRGEPMTCAWLDNQREEYMRNINPIGAFIEDECLCQKGCKDLSVNLYEAYCSWTILNNEPELTKRNFGVRMTAMFGPTFSTIKKGVKARGYRGVELK